MYFTIACVIAAVVAFSWRRYKSNYYSIQKFSRSTSLIDKTTILPLRVPWKVKFNDYNPIRTERNTFQLWWFRLCLTDGKTRLLCETSAFLFSYVPYNPLGRTGASGRGTLKYWGPNRVDIVVFMNKTNHIGQVNVFNHKITTSFFNHKITTSLNLVHSGYIDHPANTDNAWLEGKIYMSKVLQDDLVEDVTEAYPWLVDMFKYSTPPHLNQLTTCLI
jgi:hypothetical protein